MMWIRMFTAAVLALSLGTMGCYKAPEPKAEDVKAAATTHSGWWCNEHGLPEADCSMCISDAEKQKRFKDRGDWCDMHNRAKSQCFICNPKLKEKYAKMYQDKYGKAPPEPIE